MCVTTGDLDDLDVLKELDEPWRGLVWIPLHISRQILHALKAELAAGAGSPRIHIPLYVDSHGVPIATCDLVDAAVSELLDLQRIGLEWIAFTVLRHLVDHLARIAKLSHLA